MSFIEGLGRVYRKRGDSYFIEVPMKELDGVWRNLKENEVTRISSITAVQLEKEFEVIYHFVDGKNIINIKTRVPARVPQVKSVVEHFPGAELIERELWETMGLEPVGHPNLKHLLLDEKLSPKTPWLRRKNDKVGTNR
jgi:NADH-quinone oxidoreductase subunit C